VCYVAVWSVFLDASFGGHFFDVELVCWNKAIERRDSDSALPSGSPPVSIPSSPAPNASRAPPPPSPGTTLSAVTGLLDPAAAKTHVVYTVGVREFYSASEFISWSITKRYREFESLHAALTAMFPDCSIPELPPKNSFSMGNSDSVVFQRIRRLEMFLQELLNTAVFQVEPVFTFFGMNNPQRQVVAGTTHSTALDEAFGD
jgi:hypothetical protein